MSHVSTVRTEVKSEALLKAAVEMIPGATYLGAGSHSAYYGSISGVGVKLPEWRYPAVFDLATGTAKFDNYGGHWGPQEQFDRLLQKYGIAHAIAWAKAAGKQFQVLPASADGTEYVSIEV